MGTGTKQMFLEITVSELQFLLYYEDISTLPHRIRVAAKGDVLSKLLISRMTHSKYKYAYI